MGKAAMSIELSAGERQELASLARARKTGQAMARRARIVLDAAAGLDNRAICTQVGADANTVGKWRRRFAADRLDGLLDEPRPGAPRQIGDDQIADTIRLTLGNRAARRDALVAALHGQGGWLRALHHSSPVACLGPATAPDRDVQAVDRPAVC